MVIVAGWVVAAVLAVLVGVVGIGLVGAGLTNREADTARSEADVERELAQAGPAPIPTSALPTASPATAAPTTPVVSSFPTRGGTVVADCDGITSMSPAQGFAVHEQSAREGEFRGVRDDHVRVKVRFACVNGSPRVVED